MLLEILDRPIAFQRIFVTLTGSITAALMLSQAVYWTQRTTLADGWFYKGREEWTEETGMTRWEQEGARKALRDKGFMEEKLVGAPARLHYRVNELALSSALQLVGGKTSNCVAEKPPTNTETTTETTKHKPSAYAAPSSVKPSSNPRKAKVLEIPDWVDRAVWDAFVESRARLRKPMTENAKALMWAKLARFRDEGQDPVAVLNQSVLCGWTDIWKVREESHAGDGSGGGRGGPRNKILQNAEALRATLEGLESDSDCSGGDGCVSSGGDQQGVPGRVLEAPRARRVERRSGELAPAGGDAGRPLRIAAPGFGNHPQKPSGTRDAGGVS